MKRLNNLGDTIVEVLIALAVLSAVLGGAYSISNRSLTSVKQAQEHTQALKYAEQQIERLKQLADGGGVDSSGNPSNNVFTFSGGFCITSSGANLLIDNSLLNCAHGTAPVQYFALITSRTPVPGFSTSYNFVITVVWNGIHGGQDKVSLTYRLDR